MSEQFLADASGVSRRRFLKSSALLALAGTLGFPGVLNAEDLIDLPFENGKRKLAKFPQKRPLILLTSRPPQLETPFTVFNENIITPNDAFFVRYHLSGVPTSIDPEKFMLNVKGSVNTPLALSLSELKKFEPVEVVAVNQCSGNSRGFVKPRVAGGQLGNGAMGNARWKGARLRDVLAKAGLAATARQVTFNGLDSAPREKIPDFVKALDVEQAMDQDVLLAYEMNGADLPMLNGYPLRLVLPGYYGTYWVKHLNEINVVDEVFKGFWMDPGYRIPDNSCACVEPGTTPKSTRPIGRFNVRSFITSLENGTKVKARQNASIKGIAFDGGYGISQVFFSDDAGKTWKETRLEKDLGKYSFRGWSINWKPGQPGNYDLMVKAVNRTGQTQPAEALWNPPGYMRNVIESVKVAVI